MLIEWLFTFLIFYLLYKLIFDFIIPVSKASAQVRNRMNEINRDQQRQQQQHFNSNKTYSNQQPAGRPAKDDYIDFEEVK